MTYYQKVLQPDEEVKIFARLHWIVYVRAWALLIVGIIALAMAQSDPSLKIPATAAAVCCFVVGLLVLLRAWIVRATTEIVVTDRRIIHKRGLLSRDTEEMNISKVETVDVHQGIGGRLLGYGTLLIRGTGGGWEPLCRLSSPLAVRNAIIAG